MHTTSTGGCHVWYDAFGDGTPLVMVYGIGGNSRRWWEEFPRRLAGHHRVVMLDNRGTGRSDRPSEAWTVEDMVADVDAVADACELETFHLLGCSLGSIIARHYAAAHGDRLRSLSLLCPPHGTPATPEDMALGVLWDPKAPRAECERKSWVVVHPEAWIAANESALLADFELAESERTPGRTFHFQMQAVAGAPDPLPAINEERYPVLVAHGTVDRLVPPDNARTLHAAIPRSRLEWVEGASHSFWQHSPAGATDVVLRFLAAADESGMAT